MSLNRDDGSDGLSVIMCFAFDHRAPVEEVSAFKKALADCPHIPIVMEVIGTFDYIMEARVLGLEDYQAHLNRLSGPLRKLVRTYEACFVCRTVEVKTSGVKSKYQVTFWIPCSEGFKRVDIAEVNKITAEGDYMRLHLPHETCLMHTTIKALMGRLDPALFVQIHRSAIVRQDFILRLLHQGRTWSAYLKDGSSVGVSKSRVQNVLSRIGRQTGSSAVQLADSLDQAALVAS